jgi:hypothetical protein
VPLETEAAPDGRQGRPRAWPARERGRGRRGGAQAQRPPEASTGMGNASDAWVGGGDGSREADVGAGGAPSPALLYAQVPCVSMH